MCVCVCVCVFVCICVPVHVHVCVCVHMHVHVHLYIHMQFVIFSQNVVLWIEYKHRLQKRQGWYSSIVTPTLVKWRLSGTEAVAINRLTRAT